MAGSILQEEGFLQIRIEAISLDSTHAKVHPDGTGALKKRPAKHWQIQGRMDL